MQTNKRSGMLRNEARTAWVMMAPALIVLCCVAVFPILQTFWFSFHRMNLKDVLHGQPFIGLQNYISIFTDSRALSDIGFTLLFTVITVFLELIIGFASALIMNMPFRGRGAVRASVLIPWAIPTSVSAMMWVFIFNDQYGMFNDILKRMGIITNYQAWLSTYHGSLMALVISDVWKTAPYLALLILAGLQMLPEELYESAKLDGANVFQRFFNITLPLMKNTLIVALLMRTIDAFRVFDLIYVMTGGANGTESIAIYSYKQLMSFLDFGYGSALAVVIFLLVFIISAVYMLFMGKDFSQDS